MTDLTIWAGWKFTPVGEKPQEGGHAYKYFVYRRDRNLLQHKVIELLQTLAPALVTGASDPSIDDTKIQTILLAIEDQLPGYKLKHCRNFFVQGLDRGVREGLWNIHVPPPVSTVSRKKALFQPETFSALPSIRRIQSALTTTWSDPAFFGKAESYLSQLNKLKKFRSADGLLFLRAGQLLLTALLYGGLLDTKYLNLLLGHVDKLQANQSCCWIDFYEEQLIYLESGEPRQEAEKGKRILKETLFQRRWFPDSVTELLLLRWHVDGLGAFPRPKNLTPKNYEKYCQYLIHAFLVAVGLHDQLMPLRELIGGAMTDNALQLPAFLLNFSAGKISTTSLPPGAWQRLYNNCRSQAVTLSIDVETPEPQFALHEPLIGDEKVIQRYDQYRLFKTLTKQLTNRRTDQTQPHAKSIQIIDTFVHKNQQRLAPTLLRLCEWGIELYRNGSANKARLAASTVTNYVGQLQDLVNVMGSEDPLALEGEELLEIYQELIDRCKTAKAKSFKAGRIKEFHYYLQRLGYADSLNLLELEGVDSQEIKVDANYINETAYQSTLHELNHFEPNNFRLRTCRRLITMLGYRCGLRRTEAWKLRLCDIQISQYPVLLVRASKYKTVKSSHSTRQIPLKSLLTESELNELMHWLEYRKLEEDLVGFETDNNFVFCQEHSGLSLVNEASIFPVIQGVLKAVTGDEAVRYHHLRHSCANNLLLRLQGIEWPELAVQHPYILESDDQAMFGLNQSTPSRKYLYQVSVLLGHASPDITLKSYIHLSDYLLRHYLNQIRDSSLSIAEIAVLSGISRDALIKKRQRNYPGLTVLEIAKHALRDKLQLTPAPTVLIKQDAPIVWSESSRQYASEQRQIRPSIQVLHQLIEHHDTEQKNANYWSEKTGYSTEVIQAWFDAAHDLSQMKTGKGSPRHIRPQWWGLGNSHQKERIQAQENTEPPRCMPKPHTHQDRKTAQRALQRMQQIKVCERETIQRGIKYYITNSIASHSHLLMKTEDDAKCYVAFIRELGFSSTQIHCQLKTQKRPGSPSPKSQVLKWAKTLSLPPEQISEKSSIAIRGGEFGSIRVAVTNENGTASYGFRYAVYMSAIFMFAEDRLSKLTHAEMLSIF